MSGSTVLQTIMILNFLLQKWRPFHCNVKIPKLLLLLFQQGFCQKVYEQNFAFQYKILEFISRSSILSTFTISNVLLLKWRPLQYNKKVGKKPSLTVVFTSILWEILWKKTSFFNSYFQNPFQDVILYRVLKSQNFIY